MSEPRDNRLKRFTVQVVFRGYDNTELRASGLLPPGERVKKCLETHPTLCFPIDRVEVTEAYPLGEEGKARFDPRADWRPFHKDGGICYKCNDATATKRFRYTSNEIQATQHTEAVDCIWVTCARCGNSWRMRPADSPLLKDKLSGEDFNRAKYIYEDEPDEEPFG